MANGDDNTTFMKSIATQRNSHPKNHFLRIGFFSFIFLTVSVNLPGQQSSLACNTPTPWIPPTFSVTETHSSPAVACWEGDPGCPGSNVPANVVNSITTDFATGTIGVTGTLMLTVSDNTNNYDAGNFVGFRISSDLFDLGLFSSIIISTYLNGNFQESAFAGNSLIVGADLGNNQYDVGFVTTLPFDAIEITIDEGLGAGIYNVYYAIVEDFCPGPPLPCNELATIHNPDYPVFINGAHTGFTGAACASCAVINANNVIDANLANWAEIIVAAGVASEGCLSVKDQLTDYSAGTFAGFHIENPSLVNADALTGITINTYLDGALQESETDSGSLISMGSGLLTDTSEQYVGFITTLPFDEVQICLANMVGSFDIGTTRIYNTLLEGFCPAIIECDTTYYLNNPEYPVYIDAFLTGPDGVACGACDVVDEQNVITADTADYATITVLANVADSVSIAVADALYTYPAGTIAGFVIEDLGFLTEAELFESITISTYNDGVLQEARTGEDLIDVSAYVLFISADSGRYNVGFETTLPFDEIRISVGSLATAVNEVRVYSAFADTRTSAGGSLFCVDGPLAVNDTVTTNQNTPVSIDVLANDIDNESPLGSPTLAAGPSHGSVVFHPADSTFTYTPDSNFVGLDTFTYSICNDDSPAICDTALVVITVNPVTDTIEQTMLPQDSIFEMCVSAWVEFSSPADTLTVCDQPQNGTLVIIDTCFQYTPDPGFIGKDTMCVVACDVEGFCDSIIVVALVNLPLPVSWLSFEVQKTGNMASLKWVTSDEINNEGFFIERSIDGRLFENIGRVEASLYPESINRYSFIDANPYHGLNYYRIKQLDRDGTINYSGIRTLSFAGNGSEIRTSPNPVNETLTIEMPGNSGTDVEIKLVNSTGVAVLNQTIGNTVRQASIIVEDIAPGLYTLIVVSAGSRYVERIVVIK